MGFFDRFKKDKGIELTAPMKGKCVSIKEVPDPTFAEEILGKGIAVIPQDGHVYAPADGKISTVFPTGHAVGITTADGAEICFSDNGAGNWRNKIICVTGKPSRGLETKKIWGVQVA